MDSLAGVWDDLLSGDGKLEMPRQEEAPHTTEELTAARQWVKDFGVDIESLELTGCRLQDAHKSLDIEHQTLSADVHMVDKVLGHLSSIRKAVESLAGLPIGPPDLSKKLCPQLGTFWFEFEASKSGFMDRLRSVEANMAIVNALMARLRDSSGIICTICMIREISTAIVPCGHTCCIACAQRLQDTCFMCRAPFRDVQRIRFC